MSITLRLKLFVFMQFFIWGCWLTTLGSYMINTLHFSGLEVGLVYSAKGIASLFMPSLAGIVADRWIKANRLYGACHLLGAVALLLAAQVSTSSAMFWTILVYSMLYMPTLALTNAISYFCLGKYGLDSTKDYPPVRVYGTVGFICAMWIISFSGFELSSVQLYLAAAVSVLLGLYAFTLPTCPTSQAKKGASWFSMLGLDALVLFRQRRMALFLLFAMLLGAALQITNTFGNPFLHDFAKNVLYQDSFAVKYPSVLLSLSQMSEVLFILTIPFFLQRYGIKKVMLISMLAWTLRFAFFAWGTPSGLGFMLLVLSMIVYGCAFDFFNISGSIFVEKEASPHIRASAQGLFMTMVNGLGAYAGAIGSGFVVDYFTHDGVKDWQSIWLVFAAYALVLAAVFAVSFHYPADEKRQTVTG
jgi:NHS family xanthosine MFS transporter